MAEIQSGESERPHPAAGYIDTMLSDAGWLEGKKPLGEFVREIVGLDMNAAKEAFAEFLNSTALDSRQIYFVNQIVEYIVHNGVLKDMSVLQDAPFTDQGSVVDVFTDLSVWQRIRSIIDRINMNAAA